MAKQKKKEVIGEIKLQIPAGQATPAPPVGPALGARGVNIAAFVKEFNEVTGPRRGEIVPVVISVYKDKTFSFICREPPVSELIKKAAGAEKGAATPGPVTRHAAITRVQVREIAERKQKEFTSHSLEAAMATVEGTARSMGIVIEG